MAGLSTKLKRLRGEFESKTRGIQSSIERFEQAYQKSKNVLQKLESYEKTGSGLDTWVSRSGGRDNRTTTRYVGFKIGSDFETLYSTSTRQGRHRTTSSGTVPAREELDAKISQMIQAEKQKQINIPYAIADLEAQASIQGSWNEERIRIMSTRNLSTRPQYKSNLIQKTGSIYGDQVQKQAEIQRFDVLQNYGWSENQNAFFGSQGVPSPKATVEQLEKKRKADAQAHARRNVFQKYGISESREPYLQGLASVDELNKAEQQKLSELKQVEQEVEIATQQAKERESMALAKERELKLATEQVNKAEIQAQSEIRERNRLQKELRQKKKQARFEDVTKPKKVFRPKQSFFNIKAKSFRYF